MKLFIPVAALVAALSVTAAAQDNTVKSRTKIKADDAKVVSMTGCLRQDGAGSYTLVGMMAAAGDDLKTKTKVKTDVDRDNTTVKARTKSKADDGVVATTGGSATYLLVPGSNVNLASHVGHQVQVSAIVVEPGHDDADVKIKDKTTVDPDNARDTTTRSKTKVELERSPLGSYSVVSVKMLAGTCAAY